VRCPSAAPACTRLPTCGERWSEVRVERGKEARKRRGPSGINKIYGARNVPPSPRCFCVSVESKGVARRKHVTVDYKGLENRLFSARYEKRAGILQVLILNDLVCHVTLLLCMTFGRCRALRRREAARPEMGMTDWDAYYDEAETEILGWRELRDGERPTRNSVADWYSIVKSPFSIRNDSHSLSDCRKASGRQVRIGAITMNKSSLFKSRRRHPATDQIRNLLSRCYEGNGVATGCDPGSRDPSGAHYRHDYRW